MKLTKKEREEILADKAIGAKQYELLPKCLTACISLLKALNQMAEDAWLDPEKDDTGTLVEITPELVNPHMTAAGLLPLDYDACSRLGFKLEQLVAANHCLAVCDCWNLAHGLQHWQERALGITESHH